MIYPLFMKCDIKQEKLPREREEREDSAALLSQNGVEDEFEH